LLAFDLENPMKRILIAGLFALLGPLAQAGEFALDHREPIRVTDKDKSHIHMEMRQFLATTQLILAGITANDMKMVAVAAKESGVAAADHVPPGLRKKLPMEFKKMGHAVHVGFDDLARDADSLGDADHALKQLRDVLMQCVACHSTYRLGNARR
jgi:hypothetical protein